MALINCPECSREISDKANACPHCGYPIAKYAEPSLPETVLCLECKKDVPFDDQVCPHCGLFNSQKYALLESVKSAEPESSLQEDTAVRCPKCGAKNAFHADKQGFGVGKFVVGTLLVGPLTGLLAGKVNNSKVVITCLKCNHKWKA
ncbi:MAG: hypothetical protein CXR31_10130 [Geobacter sp.]|nr:MAG: hypothetical protein CXR31_10130 [Geobacter sp.]